MVFSSCSRKDLENSLEKGVGMCLFNLPEVKESFGGQKCGNGYVEDGEECDCGEPEVRTTWEVLLMSCLQGFGSGGLVWCVWGKTKLCLLCFHPISLNLRVSEVQGGSSVFEMVKFKQGLS